jgi:hypothetical protein
MSSKSTEIVKPEQRATILKNICVDLSLRFDIRES